MEYAIIESGGKQYKAVAGNFIDVDKINLEPGQAYTFNKVLLYTADGVCKIGQPSLDDVIVVGKILKQFKGDKIRVAKFKAKARFRRVTGFRAHLTRVQIEQIKIGKAEKAKKVEKETKTEKAVKASKKAKEESK